MPSNIGTKYKLVRKFQLTPNDQLTNDRLAKLRAKGVYTPSMLAHLLEVAEPQMAQFLGLDTEAMRKLKGKYVRVSTPPSTAVATARHGRGLLLGDHLPNATDFTAAEEQSLQQALDAVSKKFETTGGFDIISKMPPIRDQGQRPTCSAHAALRAFEVLKQDQQIDLSEQYLYYYMKENDGYPDKAGSTIDAASSVLENRGVCKEEHLPYQREPYENDPCQRGPEPQGHLHTHAEQHKLPSSLMKDLDPRNVRLLCDTLADSAKPIIYGVATFESWSDGDNEIHDDGSIVTPIEGEHANGAHAVVLSGFGFNDTYEGGGYFVFDNSWGTQWSKKCDHGAGRGVMPFSYALKYGLVAFGF